MVKIFRTLLVLFFFTLSSELFAQVNEVTLVTSGEGATENDAVNEALRSAIEQAYGVFVSANTDILNDELVKDEIVTVSSGNIHSYKKLGCVELANGNKSVSVEATVSVSNLVSFAQSKGASCEFAGAVFGANLKLINLNKVNAEKAIEHLYTSLESIAATMYDYEVEVEQPKADGTVEITAIAKANENYKTFTDMVYNTLKSLNVSNVEQLKEMGIQFSTSTITTPYVFSAASHNSVSLSSDTNVDIGRRWNLDDCIASLFDIDSTIKRINDIQNKAFFDFVLKDSNEKEYIFPVGRFCGRLDYSYHTDDRDCSSILVGPDYMTMPDGCYNGWSVEIFNYDSCPSTKRMFSWVRSKYLIFVPKLRSGEIAAQCKKAFKIPVEKLMTISGFTIERKVK